MGQRLTAESLSVWHDLPLLGYPRGEMIYPEKATMAMTGISLYLHPGQFLKTLSAWDFVFRDHAASSTLLCCCYRLNICVPLTQIHIFQSNPQRDGIWVRGLWDVIMS